MEFFPAKINAMFMKSFIINVIAWHGEIQLLLITVVLYNAIF